MRLLSIFYLLLIAGSVTSAQPGEAPMQYEGRYRPAAALPDQPFDHLLLLPSKSNPSIWVPLEQLQSRHGNFTAYSDKTFFSLREAYLNKSDTLPELLLSAYKEIEKTPYLSSAKRTLKFPSLFQLKMEYIYLAFPWIPLSFAAFIVSTLLLIGNFRAAAILSSWLSFLLLTLIIAMRIYILERPPVANMAETLLFVPWLATCFGLLVRREALTASSFLAVALLGAAWFAGAQTSLENVQAVLDSNYWLTVHVLLVVGSYGLFLLAGILGHAYFFALGWGHPGRAQSLAKKIQLCANAGLAMLIPGTILGGIWAAQSWGRFWDWDPKESWAFITICAYLIGVHAYRYKLIGDYGLAWASIIGAWTVTFTWYGVNYILGTGLHSYGFGNGGEKIYLGLLLADVLLCIGLAAWAKRALLSSKY